MHCRFRPLQTIVALLLFGAACRGEERGPAPLIVRRPGEIEFPAIVNAKRFGSGWLMPAYHAIVWQGGRAAREALLQADVTDVEVLDALESLGARPGDNLSMDAWEKRKDAKNPAPDTVIAGPTVEVLLRLPGRKELVALAEVLEDAAGRGFEGRFGGNRANIPKWKSGCLVCLYSCPGSKIGNARYTVRDYVKDPTRFRVREELLPADGTRIGVVIRLASSGP
ncbi:MAG: YdjY domain-containing protein [Thermoanaerobaculia bacterium]